MKMFQNVICEGYLAKNPKWKQVFINDIDETKEEKGAIYLGYGASYKQDKYIVKDKIFEGIIVGIYSIYSEKEFCEYFDDFTDKSSLHIEAISPIKVAKVYFANNKSRIVPIEKIKIWQSPF